MPSGIAYAVAARECLTELHPAAASLPAPIDDAFVRLGEALLASAPAGFEAAFDRSPQRGRGGGRVVRARPHRP